MSPLENCCNEDGEGKLEESERQKGRHTVELVEEMNERREGEMRKRGKRQRRDIMIARYKCQLGGKERISDIERGMGRKQWGHWCPSASVLPVLLCSFHASS